LLSSQVSQGRAKKPLSPNSEDSHPVSLSVLVPAFNESAVIEDNLRELIGVLDRSFEDYEIVVVDDASPDNTFEDAQKVAEGNPRVKVIRADRNGGKGHALRLGFESCCGQDVVFIDADLDLPPDQIKGFVDHLHETGVDIVVGSKRHPDSQIEYPESRQFLSSLFGNMVRFVFRLPVKDTQTGLKVYRREVLDKVFPKMRCERFAFDLELITLAHQRGFRMVERPVRLHFRRKMKFGRIHFWDFFITGLDTLGIFLRVRCSGALRSLLRS